MKSVNVILFLFALSSLQLLAQVEPVGKDKVAIGGYDVVAYFIPGKATKGNPEIKSVYKDVAYYFSTQANKDAFTTNPEKYLPQYDGWCALAVGQQKKKVNINPETFKVTDGKLYLFYNSAHKLSGTRFNSLEPWVKDEPNLIKKSDENWPVVNAKKK
jgi:YHS domain-containing protein